MQTTTGVADVMDPWRRITLAQGDDGRYEMAVETASGACIDGGVFAPPDGPDTHWTHFAAALRRQYACEVVVVRPGFEPVVLLPQSGEGVRW
jgi:hypothetical protein